MSELFEIDGSLMEGGGQILRISISLSAILGIPVRVTKIRAGRSKPGLAAQHLKGIQLAASMCQARLSGDKIGSTEIEFRPGNLKGGHYCVDTQTAGSVSLLLQVALPCALLADAPVTLDLRGGTNADMAPQIDYMLEVFRPALKKFGGDFELTIHKRGYFPKGGGRVTVNITPIKSFNNVNITEAGTINRILGWSFVSGTLPIKMAYEMSDGAKQMLHKQHEISIECYKEKLPDNCSGIILTAQSSTGCVLGGDALGKRGANSLDVGSKAGEMLKTDIDCGACFDSHAQDQIIIYMALAPGTSVVRVGKITLHTQTAIHVATLLTKAKFNIQSLEDDKYLIECSGIAQVNNRMKD